MYCELCASELCVVNLPVSDLHLMESSWDQLGADMKIKAHKKITDSWENVPAFSFFHEPNNEEQKLSVITNLSDPYPNYIKTQQPSIGTRIISSLNRTLPGLSERVKCPASKECAKRHRSRCPDHEEKLTNIIIHLNDECKWTREQIADWLESLDVDLTFPS